MEASTVSIYIFDIFAIILVVYFLRKKILSKLNEVEERHVMKGVKNRKILLEMNNNEQETTNPKNSKNNRELERCS